MEGISSHDRVFLVFFSVVSEIVVDHFLLRNVGGEGRFYHFRVETRHIESESHIGDGFLDDLFLLGFIIVEIDTVE